MTEEYMGCRNGSTHDKVVSPTLDGTLEKMGIEELIRCAEKSPPDDKGRAKARLCRIELERRGWRRGFWGNWSPP